MSAVSDREAKAERPRQTMMMTNCTQSVRPHMKGCEAEAAAVGVRGCAASVADGAARLAADGRAAGAWKTAGPRAAAGLHIC
ncbi:MAG: hypothetical protein NVSMB65_02570 [Chloroflexota bacterium]